MAAEGSRGHPGPVGPCSELRLHHWRFLRRETDSDCDGEGANIAMEGPKVGLGVPVTSQLFTGSTAYPPRPGLGIHP